MWAALDRLSFVDLWEIPLFSNSNCEGKTEWRRGKISVNLFRLVWEFEEGGEAGERQREGRARSAQA